MLSTHKRLSAGIITLLLGLGAGGAAVNASQTSSNDAPVRCEIDVSTHNGIITLNGLVHTDLAIDGSYQFSVKGAGWSGSSNIRQGGDFTADPGDTITVAKVSLGANGARYIANLKIKADDTHIECSKTINDDL